MMALPIRTRIAPAALLIAFAFVVVGFLRADRDTASAETDRADLTVSETATLVEVFLLRHLTELRRAERRFGADATNPVTSPAQTRDAALVRATDELAASFSAIWLTDSTRTVRPLLTSHSDTAWRRLADSIPGAIAPLIDQVRRNDRAKSGEPNVLIVRGGGKVYLVFVDPVSGSRPTTLVAATPVDSLSALLRRSQRTRSFDVVIRTEGDTILSLPSEEARTERSRAVDRVVSTPFGMRWTLVMTYTPAGRGVRIALWIVGLGAIVGLGVGLLLERREASRIADRSSELEHLSAELLRANRAKSEFLANVSHELRTPLNAIVGFVDLLRDGVYGALNSRQVGPLERIEASANHLRHLVDQVLDLAKMAAGRLEVHTEPLELRPFVFDIASEVEPLVTENGLSFSLTVGATLPRVRTDPTHLRQILINLLGNAVKFTTTGGISVRGKLVGSETRSGLPSVLNAATALLLRSPRPDGLWIALQVVDSGIGIAEPDCERIFDEFEQVNAGPRGDSMRRGTGLGLSISRRLARLIGGDITVESELGRGSVFTVWLPVDPADLRGDRAA